VINKNFDSGRFHAARVEEGSVMFAYGLGVVISTKSEAFQEGQWVMSSDLGWRNYAVVAASKLMPIK
jgi:NADPH-dependent curcumin reductase CurA